MSEGEAVQWTEPVIALITPHTTAARTVGPGIIPLCTEPVSALISPHTTAARTVGSVTIPQWTVPSGSRELLSSLGRRIAKGLEGSAPHIAVAFSCGCPGLPCHG